jgi:lipoyl(octanoyl) transferase
MTNPPTEQIVRYRDCGHISYHEAWDLQEQLLKENVDLKLAAGRAAIPASVPTRHHLLFCEHNPVYTLGKSGKAEHLLIGEAERAQRGIEYFHINRGGDITYHGPGQITGYPIFDLEKFKPDINWYLRHIEEAVIDLLAGYGITGGRIKGLTGVWIGMDSPNPRKICAIGVRCSRWVTMHGFAFNVNTDLSYFDHIIPCGIDDKGVTSLQKELGRKLDFDAVKTDLVRRLASQFNFVLEETGKVKQSV